MVVVFPEVGSTVYVEGTCQVVIKVTEDENVGKNLKEMNKKSLGL